MLGRYRWAKEMNNPQEEYFRLHDQITAITRLHDNAQRRVIRLEERMKQLEDILKLAQTLLGLD